MATKHGSVEVVSSDGLPPGLVIISDESVPIQLHTQLRTSRSIANVTGIENDKEISDEVGCDDVDFGVEDHTASMVQNFSQIGGHLEESGRVDNLTVVRWLREILVEDDYGKVDCKVLISLIQKEFGSRKRNTRSDLKRAFPKAYLRRSDRNRWYCGISLRSDEGKSVISIKDREWIDQAVAWLHSAMEVNPNGKERCSDVHQALTQYVGQAAVHLAISAVKMVFPSIPRKTFSRLAFYVGIRFKDQSIANASVQSASTNLNSLSDIKTEYSDSAANKLILAWLQQVLIADESSRERIKTICLMIKKKFGKTIPQAKVARLIKKMFPHVIVKLKGSVYGIIWGVRIDSDCHPATSWLQKAVSWLREIYEPAEPSFCEHVSSLFELLSHKLGIQKHSHCISLLHEAFPHIEMKEILDCQMVFGVKLKSNIEDVQFPVFTNEEQSHNEDVMHFLDNCPIVNEQKFFEEPSMAYTSSAGPTMTSSTSGPGLVSSSETQVQDLQSRSMDSRMSSVDESLQAFTATMKDEIYKINTKVAKIDENVSKMMMDISHVKDEINKLINDNVKSAQQKDSLIIQLQQTLIMLCQQQLQKFMPDGQSFSQQTLKNILQKGLLNQSPNQDC